MKQSIRWLQNHLDEKWNRQIDEDIAAGKAAPIVARNG